MDGVISGQLGLQTLASEGISKEGLKFGNHQNYQQSHRSPFQGFPKLLNNNWALMAPPPSQRQTGGGRDLKGAQGS